ncbi:hypothetical protein ACLK19_16840 [Escherichia coli]
MKRDHRRATGWRELRQTDPAPSGSLAPIVKAWFAQENSQPNMIEVATNILVTMNLVGMGWASL